MEVSIWSETSRSASRRVYRYPNEFLIHPNSLLGKVAFTKVNSTNIFLTSTYYDNYFCFFSYKMRPK